MKTAAVFPAAFTLIELSIVLVIIGLVVGGILTGRSLIESSAVSAQLAQIQEFTTAAQTFKAKYEYWPGDLPSTAATQFGFPARWGQPGYGDGNGQVNAGNNAGCCNQYGGELVVFWVDLSVAKLIKGGFSTAQNTWSSGTDIGSTQINRYLPEARIGNGNYIYLWADSTWITSWIFTGKTLFGISKVSAINGASDYGAVASSMGLSVQQAYSIDKKIDDGLPDMGKVIALYENGQAARWATTDTNANFTNQAPEIASISASPTSCYDNGGISTKTKTYTLSNGANINCALSFRFIE